GPESGHAEAAALIREARALFAARKKQLADGAALPKSPLAEAMIVEAETKAMNYLLADAYSHQDWFTAAKLIEESGTELLDKSMVATILRKSGQVRQAVEFASSWYASAPESEHAAEAYLRSLASAAGVGLASAGAPASDVPRALLSLAGSSGGQNELLGLVFSLLSGSYSSSLRSYLLFLRGSLLADTDAAIDAYRSALMERPDNVEALVALAQAYHAKGDSAKAQFYIKQAKMLGVADMELAAALSNLESALAQK
ncbi:MAG TPA: tetratricopeptide repeat protein, partial [Rectinemataceae bacterium]